MGICTHEVGRSFHQPSAGNKVIVGVVVPMGSIPFQPFSSIGLRKSRRAVSVTTKARARKRIKEAFLLTMQSFPAGRRSPRLWVQGSPALTGEKELAAAACG